MYFFILLSLLVRLISAYDVPDNLRDIYDNHKSGDCSSKLAEGFTDGIGGDNSFTYCGDIDGAIFVHSSGNGGQYANMDVDCDGVNNSGGACGDDPTGQNQTSFKGLLNQYGIDELDANIHPYVVFGNEAFNPQEYGMEPLSVMAVHYGIWGDTNDEDSTGEASISLAKPCYPGGGITGDNGHSENDVLYIGFMGPDAVPGDADWTAQDAGAFEESIRDLGDQLVAKLQN
ncbi:hypothetical protein EYZ11_006908 [Aspergillus tanneri]|uniref:Endo-chitosanase n=1 Tax=Aspergillus tanneri TaxID=1220188 RepID=A0A4V3UP43_9EURO|nr:hypothetical protein EYZ11_006908 [Aspergillus tanneri]